MTDPEADPLPGLLAALDLTDTGARTSEDIFTGPSQWTPGGRVFGGQVLAQSLVAASRTVPADRPVHSMHGYFLRPGDAEHAITFSVDRIHDGRSFTTRRTQAYQDGKPILSMIASFQTEDEGLDHQVAMPEGLPDPESLPSTAEVLSGIDHPVAQFWSTRRAFDVRHVESPIYISRSMASTPPHQAVWLRSLEAPSPTIRISIAPRWPTSSDYTLLESDAACARGPVEHSRAEGRQSRPRDVVASIRPGRTTGSSTPRSRTNAIGGRGLTLGAHVQLARRPAFGDRHPGRA